MKQFVLKFFMLLMCAIVFSLTSCDKADDDENTDFMFSDLTVSESAISINGASSKTFEIKTTAKWKINVSSTASNWLTVSPLEGTGDATITCTTSIPKYREKFETILGIIDMTAGASATVSVSDVVNNTAPAAPDNALYPADGATNIQDPFFHLTWSEATDPEDDKVNYDISYSTDNINWTRLIKGNETTSYSSTDQLKANTKYYWKVQTYDLYGAASPESKVFSFTTASKFNTWTDGEARLYQSSANTAATDPFTIIVTGDGFTSADYTAGGTWDQVSNRAIQSLNNIEPYKTWGKYLRIIRVAAYSTESGISEHSSSTGTLKTVNTKFNTSYDNIGSSAWTGVSTNSAANNIFDYCLQKVSAAGYNITKNYTVLVLQNISHYNGTVFYYPNSRRTLGFVCMCPGSKGTMTGLENVICHEIGGHAIGHLADLYTRATTISAEKITETKEMQALGWYQNVSVINSTTECPWSMFFTASEKNTYYPLVGLYEGARSATKGIWRPQSAKTCMNDNCFEYDAPSRYSIIKQIMECVGQTVSWQQFVAKDYDRTNSNFSISRSFSSYSNTPALPEPIIIKE